ncbi:MAG: hypothetical protein M1816_004806 [Peltula sp. TS41687]|nr:MAG: hypothetical protein M1816_004806 [Peltula sp. TS41687]
MPFIDLDTINFYKPPIQGRPSFDKQNRLSNARVMLGNQQFLNLEECNGWASISKDTKVNEVGDKTGSEGDGDLVSHHTWAGERGEESRSQEISTLASNQQNHGEVDDFPSINELLSPTKQNRVITTMDPSSECPLKRVDKQTVIDLTGPSSPRAGASQEFPMELDHFDGTASSLGCDDCDANGTDIVARADAREVAPPQSVENGLECRASFDAISPLPTSAAGLINGDAGDSIEDGANEGVEKDVHAFIAEGQKHAPPRGDFVACHPIEPLHEACRHRSPDQAGQGGSGESDVSGELENRHISSISGRGEGGEEDDEEDDEEDEEEIEETIVDADDCRS